MPPKAMKRPSATMPPKAMKRPAAAAAAADDGAAAAEAEVLEKKKGKRSKKSPVSPTWTHGKLSSDPANVLSNILDHILDRIGQTVNRDLKVMSTFQGLSPFASFGGKGETGIKEVCTAVDDGKHATYALLQHKQRATHIVGKLAEILDLYQECFKHGKSCHSSLLEACRAGIDVVMAAGDAAYIKDAAHCLASVSVGGRSVYDLRWWVGGRLIDLRWVGVGNRSR